MSEQVERRLLDILDHPTESPYGNPIPALDELGDAPAERFLDGVDNLLERVRAAGIPVEGVVKRLAEPMQFEPELLSQLREAGVVPGASIRASPAGRYVAVQALGAEGALELPPEVATHLYIAR